MTAVDVDALDKLREAATAGEWDNPYPFTKLIDAPGSTDNLAIVQCDNAADAALIVAAVNSLPELLAEVRRGRALREAVEAVAEDWDRTAAIFPEYGDLSAAAARSLRDVLAATDGTP